MRWNKPKKTHVYLIIILAAASVATLLSTFIIYRNSYKAAEESLRLQALGIAASLEPSLQAKTVNKNIFRDIITEASWEGIAFMALYDPRGITLIHSNENLVGKKTDSAEIAQCATTQKPVFSLMTLGTGEEVFVLDFPIHAAGGVKVLRLALHPYQAQDIIRQAKLQALSILVSIVFLWIMGFFFIKAVVRSERLSAMMAERERLAVIGEMAAVLAHEIRNPLGSIKGFAQYLVEKGAEGDVELGVIISEARRLERLTEDLLLYARPSEVRVEEFSLSDLAHETARFLAEPASDKNAVNVDVKAPTGLTIASDREKLKQIISNILQNAVDAAGSGGSVSLEAKNSGDKIIIIVRDNGCGMDEQTRSRAFNSFFTTKTKGTGLGLAIVDQLTRALGGSIEIESEPGMGTVVRMELPQQLREDK